MDHLRRLRGARLLPAHPMVPLLYPILYRLVPGRGALLPVLQTQRREIFQDLRKQTKPV